MTATLSDLRQPARGPLRGAWANGYEARLEGRSRYAVPYGDAMERRCDAGERLGWLSALASAWWEGWHVADSLVGERSGP